MKILLISREYPPETAFGGIATFVQLLARGLTMAGHQAVVIAQTFGAEREEMDPLPSGAGLGNSGDSRGVRVLRIAVPALGPLHPMSVSLHLFAQLFARRVAACAQELYRDFPFEIIETPDHLAEGVDCLDFAQAHRIPVITRLYSPWSLLARMGMHLPGANNPSDRAAVGSMEERLLRRSQALTSPSRDLAARVAREYGLRQEEIAFIPNPVDTERFHPREQPEPLPATDGFLAPDEGNSNSAPITPDDPSPALLFVGRLEDRKGCRDLPALWAALKPRHPLLRLTILGPDTPNTGIPGVTMLQWLTGEFARLGMRADLINRHGEPAGASDPGRTPAAGTVELLPRVSLDQLAQVYRAHDILLAPSRYDNSPYTVVEAMCSGLAVIATNAGGSPEYLGAPADCPLGGYTEGPGGRIVRPGDLPGLVAALEGRSAAESLLDAPEVLDRVRRAARIHAAGLCDLHQVAALTVQLYERALARISQV